MSPIIRLITRSVAPGTWRVFEGDVETSAAYGLGGGLGGGGGADAGAAQRPVGSITPFFLNISLIIRHTAEIHEDVQDLLRQLRRLQDLQISVEVRFITVEDSFFEQIGVDFDVDIHTNSVGRKTSFAVPVQNILSISIGGLTAGSTATGGAAGGVGGSLGGGGGGIGGISGGAGGLGGALGGGGGIGGGGVGGSIGAGGIGGATGGVSIPPVVYNPFRDYSLGNNQPVVVGLGAPGIGNFSQNSDIQLAQGQSTGLITPFNNTFGLGSGGAGMTVGVAFLSDLETYLFLSAAQGDIRNNIVQAPKVTTFNGASATVFNTTTRYFVQMTFPIVGFGAIAFQPIPGNIPDGVTLRVTPVVSADRRYVRMTLSPNFISFQGFQNFPTTGAVGGGGLGGGATAISSNIQLPIVGTTIISTTVTVPDGGTVLMGGVKVLRESRLEFGVPVLSKIPMIDRLFRNIGIGRDTSSLMMMVTPRIIILEEEEERLGIPTIQF